MKLNFPRRLLLISFVFAILLNCFPAPSIGQTCTNSNTPPVNKKGWIKGAQVPVWIDPAITGDRRAAIIQAFNNWGSANTAGAASGNNSQVTYTFVDTPPPEGTGYTVHGDTELPTDPGTIKRGNTRTHRDANGNTVAAETSIDLRVTDYTAVLEVMAHEIGHPSGLTTAKAVPSVTL